MKKIMYLFMAIGLIGLLMVSGCNTGNTADRTKCVNSGGSYEKGFSETGGVFYTCECPSGKYVNGGVCKTITQTEVNLCESESNQYVDCTISGNSCRCVYKDSGTVSYFSISQLINMDCACLQDGCVCGGGGIIVG